MMEDWIRNTFAIHPSSWPTDDGDAVDSFAFVAADGNVTESPIGWFVKTFGSVPTPPTAANLKAVDPGNTLEWHRHFDAWAARGLVQES